MEKKTLLVTALALLVALVVAACGSPAAQAPAENPTETAVKDYNFAVFMPNGGDPYFQNKSYGYIEGARFVEATNPGVKVNVAIYDAGGYDQAEKQISQVEDVLQSGVDAIMITPCDQQALVPVVDKAMAAGIPVVNDGVWVATQTTTSISENSCNVGRSMAEYIARNLNGQGNVVMLMGAPGAFLFTERARCAHEEFARYPGMKVIAEDYDGVRIQGGRQLMDDWIQAYGHEINAVWSTNSTVSLGAIEALKSAGFQKGEVTVVAVDLHPEAIKYMQDGWLTGIVPSAPVKLARMAVQYAFAAANGQPIPKLLYTTDEMVVDSEMLPTFDQSDAVAPPGWKPPLR